MAQNGQTKVVSVRLPKALADELEDLAERRVRTVSQELLIAVRRHVKPHRRKETVTDAANTGADVSRA